MSGMEILLEIELRLNPPAVPPSEEGIQMVITWTVQHFSTLQDYLQHLAIIVADVKIYIIDVPISEGVDVPAMLATVLIALSMLEEEEDGKVDYRQDLGEPCDRDPHRSFLDQMREAISAVRKPAMDINGEVAVRLDR